MSPKVKALSYDDVWPTGVFVCGKIRAGKATGMIFQKDSLLGNGSRPADASLCADSRKSDASLATQTSGKKGSQERGASGEPHEQNPAQADPSEAATLQNSLVQESVVQDRVSQNAVPQEIGGPKGAEPTRFGDWERNGRCSDF